MGWPFSVRLVVPIKPVRVVKEEGDVTIVEVFEELEGRRKRLAGYFVYGGKGDSSVLHPTLEAAEIEFLRRTWDPIR